jgi:multidrug efflux pump subunit AcrB
MEMNPVIFAMRHPITTLILVIALIGGGCLAATRMRVDIFPSLNSPKIYVFLQYGGMSPSQMEDLIVNQFELLFQYVDNVKSIESRSIQQVALVELSFVPGAEMGEAIGQVVAMANRAMSRMPPGTLPPMIMRMDAGSIPVGYLVMSSKVTSLGMMGDLAQNMLRPLVQENVPGTVTVSPFGPNMRSILVNINPAKLKAYNLSPQNVVDALMTGNVVIPAGNLYIKDSMPMVPSNSLITNIQDIGKIPLRIGKNVYIRDIATIDDGIDVTYGYALVNGKKAVYLPIIKKDTASTLTVVADIDKSMSLFRDSVPKDVTIEFEFDESPAVVAAIRSVATEGLIGASLTGLMIMIFLRDIRSVIVVVANIPIALLGSLFGLWLSGNTINIMSLGGLALAIGILVDEATVTVENTNSQMKSTSNVATAALRGNNVTAVPRLLALLCILSVFIPAFLMSDPLRSLFLPLTLAVGFAMISSYLLSSTLVPVLCSYLFKPIVESEKSEGLFERMRDRFQLLVGVLVRWRWMVVPGYIATSCLIIVLAGSRIGTELFPQIDSGEFVLRFRPPSGSNFELTREMGVKCLEEIQHEAKPENILITMGYVGQVAPNYGMNNIVLFMRGPDDGQLRVALRDGSGIKLSEFRERLRKVLPDRVIPWMARRLEQGGLSKEQALQQASTSTFGFGPGDIVSDVMSFGSMTPISVRIVGTDLDEVRRHAQKIVLQMKSIPFLRDVLYEQSLDYPTVEVDIDREKAGLSGVKVQEVGNEVVSATSSSRFIALNYWANPKTGFDYQVEVLVPTYNMTSAAEVETLPITMVNSLVNLMIRDVAKVRQSTMPGELDRAASQRFLSITANVEGEDMGRAFRQVAQAIEAAGSPPRGVRVIPMGQLPPTNEMFLALEIGLGIALLVILLLLTAYFQAPRLAIISIGAVPGVFAGIATMLCLTGTTLNIESFMGSIMCLGVSVSNSVMLVTFMTDHWKSGKSSDEAAILGSGDRLRAILMTACAMTIGMVPMALALEKGSQMEAPLGRAVIGGLVMSTFATLLMLPPIFALLIGRSVSRSPSIYPDDPDSARFDPTLNEDEDRPAEPVDRPNG